MRMAAASPPMAATTIAKTAGGIATAHPRDLLRLRTGLNVCPAEDPILPTVRPRARQGRRLFAAVIPAMRYTSTGIEMA